MSTPTTADPPPYVPIRHSGWPVRHTPMWALLALVLLAGAAVLVSLSHKPSHAQQAADFNSYIKDMNAAVESCAGGVTESQQALDAVSSGAQASGKTILGMVSYNAANCSPANNESLADLTQYQVVESLARFNLQKCADDFVAWSFDAVAVQTDMASVISARSASARSTANATLQRDLRTLNAERGTINSILRSAEQALSDHTALPSLTS